MPQSSSTSASRASAASVSGGVAKSWIVVRAARSAVGLDDDEPVAEAVERAREPRTALAVAAQDVERLGDARARAT